MVELLSRLYPSDLTVVLITFAALMLIGVVSVVAQVIRAIHRHREREIAAAVVAEMLDRKIAPQEIVAVLKAMGLEAGEEKRGADDGQDPASARLQQIRAKLGIG